MTARKDGGPLLRHPQAAIKQKLENVQFSDYDMKIEFNSRAQWWFPNSKKDISKSQIDFSVFAANAIGKGLGFMTGLQSIPINRTILSSRNSFSFFRPQLGSVTDLSHDFNRKPVLTAFDSLIYVNGMSMTRNMDNLNAIPHNNLTDLISVVEGNKSFIKDSITFFRHTMTRIPIIKFEELPLPLEILWRNTSFCDVQIKMDSKKYAMEFALGNHQKLTGTTLKKEMDKAKMKTIFGPLSLKVFDLLGYTINTTLPLPTYVTPDGFSVDDGFAAATELDAYFDGNEETNFPGISTEPDQPAAGDLEIGTLSIPTVTNIPFARDPEILNGELGDTETTAIGDELLNCDDIHDYLDVLLDPCEQNQTRNDSENSRETKRQRTAKGPVLVIQVPHI